MCLRTIRTRQCTFQRDLLRGVSGQSAHARSFSKGTCCGESQDYPAHLSKGFVTVGHRAICLRQHNFQRDLLRRVSGISARGSASFKATCCGESQEYPLAPERLPKEHAAGILCLIRPRKAIFQRDMLRSVTGLSARASALSTGSCCGESQEYQSASGHLSTWKCCGES